MSRILAASVGLFSVLALHAVGCGNQELYTTPAGTTPPLPDGGAGGSSGSPASEEGGDRSIMEGGGPSIGPETGSGGSPAFERPTALGAPCSTLSDCSATPGLTCLTAERDLALGLGAPPSGLCSARCTSDAECQQYRPGSVCGTFSEVPLSGPVETSPLAPRFCLEPCTLGAPGGPSKCHGRSGMACRPFAPPAAVRCASTAPFCGDGQYCFRGYCREFACGARCNADADCAAGRHCDTQSGLCVERAQPPVPIGASCDPDATSNPCQSGSCLVMLDENGLKTGAFCTVSCEIGQGCGNGRGACWLPRFADYEVGDIGYCQATCSCDGDCQVPGDGCVPWSSSDAEQLYASKGACENVSGSGIPTLSCAAGAGGSGNEAGSSGLGGAAGAN